MIKLQAIGHLGRDAIVNNVNGKTVINFNVAHTEKYRDSNGSEVQRTTWVSCAYWSDKTKVAQYLLKGSQVYVEGTPDVKTYKNSEGEMKANLTLRVNSIQLLGGAKHVENNPQAQSNNQVGQAGSFQPGLADVPLTGDDDLPF